MTSRIKHIVSAATLTLAAVAVLAPAAQARILVSGPAFGTAAAQQSSGPAVDRLFRDFPASTPQAAIGTSDQLTRDFPTSSPVQLPVRVAVSAPAAGSSFDWTAAAIGASLAGVLLIVLGAGMVARGTRAGSLAT
jgi:hypothetical protein